MSPDLIYCSLVYSCHFGGRLEGMGQGENDRDSRAMVRAKGRERRSRDERGWVNWHEGIEQLNRGLTWRWERGVRGMGREKEKEGKEAWKGDCTLGTATCGEFLSLTVIIHIKFKRTLKGSFQYKIRFLVSSWSEVPRGNLNVRNVVQAPYLVLYVWWRGKAQNNTLDLRSINGLRNVTEEYHRRRMEALTSEGHVKYFLYPEYEWQLR